ncbi:hypothetical protein FRB94_002115 [Tulasnella sp. JGI-2019a]|nr:hypothetical protein FRB93_009119 [Tulasnella sp. JGI-2019a]KAG9013521.1 hypothetical protein FRB94_002115 [Tulasnella sp. JGI-2019a]KAG9037216.1 hypothetical protein FRB95_006469 [Tulasnella sp. JGI-2019a]
MSYQYYQQQPQWGTQQYQLAQPPQPYFQPQQGWGGRQFFNAQAGLGHGYNDWEDDYGIQEEGFFNGVFRGIKDMFSRGVGREEARLCHRQVYGGLVPIDQLEPDQLGAAAGYEAVRHWTTYRSTYQQSFNGMDDRGREREALAGLAAGEAVKLLNYSQVPRRRRARREAAEIAAATAERIFAEDFDDPYAPYEGGVGYGRNRRRSFGVNGGGEFTGGPGVLRRRRSSFGGAVYPNGGLVQGAQVLQPGIIQQQPLMAATTGGTYLTGQRTGGYVSAQPTGVSYVSAQQTGMPYGAGQQYVTATGQPVQYMQGTGLPGGVQYQQPGYTGGVQYIQPGQPQYTGAGYGGQQMGYAGQGVQYVQAQPTGYTAGGQVMYPGQQQQYVTGGGLGAPVGYQRGRATSFGGGYAGGQYL